MRAYTILPENYREVLRIDLQRDRKTARTVNIGAAAATVGLIAAGMLFVPVSEFFHMEPLQDYFMRLLIFILSYAAYMVLHELTHGLVMKAVGAEKVKFGFSGMYAFAGSRKDYFDKGSYLCIALAPLTVWGIVFGVLSAVVPREWFWNIWLLQACNVGGAAGDIYVSLRIGKMPGSVLVRDTGTDMTVYDA